MSERYTHGQDRRLLRDRHPGPVLPAAGPYGAATRGMSVGRVSQPFPTRLSDAQVAATGLAVATPLAIAMVVGSTVAIIGASALSLAASLLSPMTGLLTVAFLAPFPRPLVIPTPGLYVALLGAVLLGLVFRLPIDRPRLSWPSREVWLLGAYLLFVTAHFVGGLVDGPASSRGNAIASMYSQIMTALLTFMATGFVLRGRSPYPVLVVLISSAIVASAAAIAQASSADAIFGGLMGASDEVNRTAVDRVTGPFLDPNYFGAYLATATTLGLAFATIARSARLKAALVTVSAFVGIGLVLTLSRGALVALAAGLMALAFSRGTKFGVVSVATVLLIAVVAWPLFAEVRYAANPDLAAGGLASQLDSSDRTEAWLGGLEAFLSSPVFGVGLGQLVETASTGIAAHNWYVSVLAETGIMGFMVWMLFIVSSVLTLRRKPRSARTVGYSVLAAWLAASMFIEVPKVYGATALALIVLATALVADWRPDEPEHDTDRMPRGAHSARPGLQW